MKYYDDTETPYCLFLDKKQFSTLPAPSDSGRSDLKLMAHLADGTQHEWDAELK